MRKLDLTTNQNRNNRRSGKRCADYEQLEKEYQEAQEHWSLYQDAKSWERMWLGINLAVFNVCNMKLEGILPKDEIEDRASDITYNIIRSMLKKKKNGKPWKIEKLSSAVYLPCLALYSKALIFYDRTLGEKAFIKYNDSNVRIYRECADSYMENGILHIHRDPRESLEKEKNKGMNFIQAFNYLSEQYKYTEDEIKECIGIIEDNGMLFFEKCNERQGEIIQKLIRLLEGDVDE